MGNCPFPYMLAALMPFFVAMFRTARKKPVDDAVKHLRRAPGQYLPKQQAGELTSVG